MLRFPDCWSLLAPANFCTEEKEKLNTTTVKYLLNTVCVWKGGKQQESVRQPNKALSVWEEATTRSMSWWLEAVPQYWVREHSADPEKVTCLPQLGMCYRQPFCSFSHDMPLPCLCKLAWQDQIVATASICCFLRHRGEKLSLTFSRKNSTFHGAPLMIRRFHCSLPYAKIQNGLS